MSYSLNALLVCGLLVCSSLVALAGTDLVLPAIPELPSQLGGDASSGQYVLAAFAAGVGLGLIAFGELGAWIRQSLLLVMSLTAYGVISLLAAHAVDIQQLITLRFFQGFTSACAAVVAPGIIRALFDESGALRALGILGSIESLAPAIAPIIGVWLLAQYGWPGSFLLTAYLAFALALLTLISFRYIPNVDGTQNPAAYLKLLINRPYLRYASSYALALSGLLVFVFGAPVVIVQSMEGELRHFIIMQLIGISTFILAANTSQRLVARYGSNRVITGGALLSLLGAASMTIYGLFGARTPQVLYLLFIPLNMGLGFRGPPSFYQALVASEGDDARASALLILFVMLFTASGTALVAQWIDSGLLPVAIVAFGLTLMSGLPILSTRGVQRNLG